MKCWMRCSIPKRLEEIQAIKSIDDMDDDDECREENAYLLGNVEDRSTSAMYYDGSDLSIEPNQSETTELGNSPKVF